MPRRLQSEKHIKVGDFYEDCGFHPCLAIEVGDKQCADHLRGISLVDGGLRSCSSTHCGVRLLTKKEAIHWKLHGPADFNKRKETYDMENMSKWWIPKPYVDDGKPLTIGGKGV
jgi:hypothetical protein